MPFIQCITLEKENFILIQVCYVDEVSRVQYDTRYVLFLDLQMKGPSKTTNS